MMLFQEKDTLEDIWHAVKHELRRGALDVKHPFHWINLGTVSSGFPSVRTVVLRQVSSELHFLIYTDFRSEKCKELQENPKAVLHLYHPRKQVQVRVKAKATLHFRNDLAEGLWEVIPEHRRLEYSGDKAPGTPIDDPKQAWGKGNASSHFFSVLEFSPVEIDVLQLRREGHLRVVFTKEKDWKGAWMVP